MDKDEAHVEDVSTKAEPPGIIYADAGHRKVVLIACTITLVAGIGVLGALKVYLGDLGP